MASDFPTSAELEQIAGDISEIFRALENGFRKLDKIKDPNRQTKQLEALTWIMRECKSSALSCHLVMKEFDRQIKDGQIENLQEVDKQLNEMNQSMDKDMISHLAWNRIYTSSLDNKSEESSSEIGDAPSEPAAEVTIQMPSATGDQAHTRSETTEAASQTTVYDLFIEYLISFLEVALCHVPNACLIAGIFYFVVLLFVKIIDPNNMTQ